MTPFEWPSKVDRAINAGFDPHEAADEPTPGPITPAITQWAHQQSRGCEQCGDRCDDCGDRMCSTWGPEPAPRCPAHPTCTDCAYHVVHCSECGLVVAEATQDAAADKAYKIERER